MQKESSPCFVNKSARGLRDMKAPILTSATRHRYYACISCHERTFFANQLVRCFTCNGLLSVCVACSLSHPLSLDKRVCQRCKLKEQGL